jgi:hypothetical protein
MQASGKFNFTALVLSLTGLRDLPVGVRGSYLCLRVERLFIPSTIAYLLAVDT